MAEFALRRTPPRILKNVKLPDSREGALLAWGAGIGLAALGLVFIPGLTVGLIIVGLAVWFVFAFSPVEDRRFVLWALYAALGIKIVLACIYQLYLFKGGVPIFAPDGEVYSKFGWYISRIFLGRDFHSLPSSEYVYWNYDLLIKDQLYGKLPPYSMYQIGPYSYFLGYLYTFFGYSPVLARIVNIVLSALSAFLVMRIVSDLAGSREAKLAFVGVLFWPSMSLFSLGILKDPAVVFGIVLAVWSVHHLSRETPIAALGAVASLVIVALLRWETALVLLVALSVWAAVRLLNLRKALVLGVVVGIFFLGTGRAEPFLKNKMALAVAKHVGYQRPGEIGGFPGVYYNILPPQLGSDADFADIVKLSWWEMGKIYFRGVAHYLTEPWPTHLKSTKLKIFFPQMVLWYGSVILAVPGLFVLWRKNSSMGILIALFLSLFISVYGMSEGNIGTLIRHRDMVTPVVLILAVVGAGRFFDKWAAPCKS